MQIKLKHLLKLKIIITRLCNRYQMIGIEDGIVNSIEIMKQHPVNMITMDTKYSPINQAKAFVTYSRYKIRKQKP